LSLAEIAYSRWSFASLTLLRKVEEEPQLLVVFVVTTAAAVVLEEEHMACLDQQHSGKEGQADVVVEDLPISDFDDSFNLDCICCLKGNNYSAAEGVYYKCL